MLKTVLLIMILMTGLIADTATKPFPKKVEQATNSEPPKVVDKTWIFCAKSENRFYYFDAATVKFDADLQASLVWVKQFDIPGERIRVMRYAYRNDGSEFSSLGMAEYDKDMKFLSSTTIQRHQLVWSMVIPGTVAEGIKDGVLSFYKWLREEQSKSNTGTGTTKL